MSDAPSPGPVKSIMPTWVRGPQDFIGGIALMAIAIFALWASSDLQGMHGFSFGAGTAPRMFAVLLLGLGVAVALFTLLGRLRAPQDYFGGAVLMAIALFALWASSDLQGMHGFSFGAGTAPRMFGVLLLALGAAVAVTGVFIDGPELATYHWRGPLFVMLAIVAFAVSIRPLGLVVSGLASFLISALGTHETRWVETVIVGVCLTIGCALLFPYVLGLPMPLFPRFLVQ